MHPTGIEPALKASEAFVLSIRLRMQNVTNLLHHPEYDIIKKVLCLPCFLGKYQEKIEISLRKGILKNLDTFFRAIIVVQTVG